MVQGFNITGNKLHYSLTRGSFFSLKNQIKIVLKSTYSNPKQSPTTIQNKSYPIKKELSKVKISTDRT